MATEAFVRSGDIRTPWRRRILAAVATTALLGGAAVLPREGAAHAATISGDKAKIAAIEQQIAVDGGKIEALSNAYDQAQGTLQAEQAHLAALRVQMAATRKAEAAALARLRQDAVDAYMNGGGAAPAIDALLQSNLDTLAEKSEFLRVAGSELQDALTAYERRALETARLQKTVDAEIASTQATLSRLETDRRQAEALVASEDALLRSVKGNLQHLLWVAHEEEVAAAEAAARAAAARAAAARAAAEAAASRAASQPGGGNGAVPAGGASGQIPANWSAMAAVAVRTALAQVGTPYVWGGAAPGGFDCSGLVMYAWSVAGIQLPHYSGAQYDDTLRISASQLQPGDIVFYNSPYDGVLGHEAMYIGNGQVVQAPMTGMDVMVTSITWAGPPVAYGQPI
jgi:cell wall-associated NlpC family hydrolase